jgi:pimeloyl-ACP methyl ester carboxylesterase
MNAFVLRLLLTTGLLMTTGCSNDSREQDLARAALQQRKQTLAEVFQACPRDSSTALAGLVARSQCLVYTVPENPQIPDGRQLSLQVMVVPAIRPLAEPDPLVILVGGPGQAATVDAIPLLPAFERIRQSRDILLVDQRGTGRLSPFTCDFSESEDELIDASAELLLQTQNTFLQECLDSVVADPRYYTTDLAVNDLDAIRDYLGYDRLNLWGGSYGTRVALAYLKYHPAHVRTVTIDGVAPPGVLPLEAAFSADSALQKVFALCREEAACDAAFPALQDHYQALMQDFDVARRVSLVDMQTGIAREVPLSADGIQSLLFLMLYSRETARLIPLLVEDIFNGNYQALAGLSASAGAINIGMHYSVICSEDLPLLDQERLTDAVFAADMLVRARIEGCKVWPSRQLDEAFFSPTESDTPVLIFSGSQDPVTPRRWGDQVAATLANALHVEGDGIGHIVSPYGCAPELIATLVETGSLTGLDPSCLENLHPRAFFISRNGSASGD